MPLAALQGSVWAVATMVGGFVIHAYGEPYGYRVALGIQSAGFVLATLVFVPLATQR